MREELEDEDYFLCEYNRFFFPKWRLGLCYQSIRCNCTGTECIVHEPHEDLSHSRVE